MSRNPQTLDEMFDKLQDDFDKLQDTFAAIHNEVVKIKASQTSPTPPPPPPPPDAAATIRNLNDLCIALATSLRAMVVKDITMAKRFGERWPMDLDNRRQQAITLLQSIQQAGGLDPLLPGSQG